MFAPLFLHLSTSFSAQSICQSLGLLYVNHGACTSDGLYSDDIHDISLYVSIIAEVTILFWNRDTISRAVINSRF